MTDKKEDHPEGAEVVPISSHPEYVLGPKPEPHDMEAIREFLDEAFSAPKDDGDRQAENRRRLIEDARRQGDPDEWCKRMRNWILKVLRGDE